MSEIAKPPIKEPTINFAIGPNCPVRCEGCYNHFGDTARFGGLVSAQEVVDFAATARDEGVTQTTVSGGDPLFHPEIVTILRGLKDLDMVVKLDTVGTAFLGDAPIIFKGRGMAAGVRVSDIAPYVDYVNVPLDGARQDTIQNFRRGRANLFAETRVISGLLRNAGIAFGFNTVANASNVSELPAIRDIAEAEGATEWQVFEYDSKGPNPTNRKNILRLAPGQFAKATRGLTSSKTLKVVCKSLETRSDAYFLVDDSGHAWKPELSDEGVRDVKGHITRDRDQVVSALRNHIVKLRTPSLITRASKS